MNPLAGKAGAGNDARAHLVHERKHLILVGPGVFFDSVKTQRAGRAAAALIERRNEDPDVLFSSFSNCCVLKSESFHTASVLLS